MKIGIQTAFSAATPPELIREVGPIIEERGFHSIWVPEHAVFFPEYQSRYPYSADGKLPGNPTGVMEPLTALTFVAAHTERLRLGTGIVILPQRNPVYAARQAADVDYLSGGRLDFGLGVGWLQEEFEALGVPWQGRGARADEYVAVLRTCWCDEVSSHEGELYSLPPCLHNPKPVQKPHPPLYFGGESEPALRRVARLGQGWFGFDLSVDALAGHLARLDELLAKEGRARSDVKIQVSPKGQRLEDGMLEAFEAHGVDQIVLPLFARDADGLRRRADALARQVLS